MAQNPASVFGKILRIDPLGTNAPNGQYGIPADNPFTTGAPPGTRPEIWALGLRNPQRFGWDPANGNMYVADIGQNTVEELSPVTAGANLGWNVWEGSFRFVGRNGVDTSDPRADHSIVFPIAEYDHSDPVLSGRSAATGVVVYRGTELAGLNGRILFGDMPSGEIFHVSADNPPGGGDDAIRRVLFRVGDETRTLLQLIQEKNREQGREPASRADLRFGQAADGRVFILNKHDGTVRLLTAGT
jgi:glucose/arabinose dehydrogenase